MRLIGNILWFLLVGLWSWLVWVSLGIIWCITLLGIPVGLQCFKFAGLSAFPFGKDVEMSSGTGSTIINIIWIFLGGFELALGYLTLGIIFFITLIGIPFGKQCFKLMKLSLFPMGAKIVKK